MANHKGYIAGGCFKGLFTGEKIKDIDLFFINESDAKEAKEYFSKNEEFKQAWGNDRVTAFKCLKTGIVVEVIFSFCGDPVDMISNFDFSITKAFYAKSTEGNYEFFSHHKFFEHLMNKKLVIDDKILFPLSTFNRSYRYRGYGFYLCGESKEKLVQSLQGAVLQGQNDFYAGID
jgi:hypothetical protein